MMKETTCYGCDKPNEPDYWMIRGEIWSDDIAFLEAHNGTSSEVQAAMEEWENNAVPLYKTPVTTDKFSAEKLQKELESCIQTLIEASEAATIMQDIVVGNLVDRKLADLAKTHKLAVDYIEKVTGENIDVVLAEKLQEIRVEELKDFNSKILQAELENQKLQKEIDAAKKYIEESYKADKEDNKLLDLIIEAVAKLKSDNKTLKKYIEHVIGTIKHDGHLGTIQTDWILPDLEKALAAIGGDDD
ncbi:hypothetical protein [Lactococcus phage P1045]|nr:hypothetical protein H1N76_gp26 [Lactococcus phage P1045]QGJ84855.1 hypothetical protein [Lactococcus phage P1045]